MRFVYLERIDVIQALDIIVDDGHVQLLLLWQPLITKTNDHTNSKSLSGISSGEFTRELDKESLLN